MLLFLWALGCAPAPVPPSPADPPAGTDPTVDTGTAPTARPTGIADVDVLVTLDGVPAGGVGLVQGGGSTRTTTDADGAGRLRVDFDIPGGDVQVVASHPEARIRSVEVSSIDELVRIALHRYDTADDPLYPFADPGEPTRRENTGQCAHCHITINEDWYASPHRTSASNPVVQDVYAGVPTALDGAFGGCADCHAPGIDGALGGRDLREATGIAYDYGVHCDVCHKVDRVVLDAEPGVGGRLVVTRPSESTPGGISPGWQMLLFGPYDDVATAAMGSVPREHFEDATLCAGCHEQLQPVLVPGVTADPVRWPDGRLPIHTTYGEWLAGPMSPGAPCQSCHMPPDPDVGNAADLGNLIDEPGGIVTGWPRPPGEVRKHAWYGPRQRASGMLELAAAVSVEKVVNDGTLTATIEVKNVGPGHAIPTGEPMRSLVLLVDATCAGAPLTATGGDVVPDFGGSDQEKAAGNDWGSWPGAQPGQVVRVVRLTGVFRDYAGYGPFGDGTFDAAQKGMPVEELVGEATILAMDGDRPVFDRPLPDGDLARLGSSGAVTDGSPATARAGAPGFGFARVLVDASGARMVPHYLAVDVASDNRLLPQQSYTTVHRFDATCPDPEVHAVLVHRAWPYALSVERGWALVESVMAEVRL